MALAGPSAAALAASRTQLFAAYYDKTEEVFDSIQRVLDLEPSEEGYAAKVSCHLPSGHFYFAFMIFPQCRVKNRPCQSIIGFSGNSHVGIETCPCINQLQGCANNAKQRVDKSAHSLRPEQGEQSLTPPWSEGQPAESSTPRGAAYVHSETC